MTFKKEDLIQVCPDCNGEGYIYDPPRPTGGSTYGTHQIMGRQTTNECHKCNKTGEVLTEQGEAVASVVMNLRKKGRI